MAKESIVDTLKKGLGEIFKKKKPLEKIGELEQGAAAIKGQTEKQKTLAELSKEN